MLYQTEVLDRQTGELVPICSGNWITVTELGNAYDLGPRQVRQVLRHLGWIYAPAHSSKSAYRLCPDAIKAGLGKHIVKSKSGRPFDVISPLGQERFAQQLPAALSQIAGKDTTRVVQARASLEAFKQRRIETSNGEERWTTQMEVSWLEYFWPHLSQDEMAAVLRISKQLVSYHVLKAKASREKQRKALCTPLYDPRSKDT